MPAHTGLAQGLRKLGHEVAVLSFANPFDRYGADGIYDLDGINVRQVRFVPETVWSRGLRLPQFTQIAAEARQLHAKFSAFVQEFQPDVIDSQEYNGLAFFYAREHKFPLVVRSYGPLAHLMRSGDIGKSTWIDTELVEVLEQATIAEADCLVACALDVARRASVKCGRALEDFQIIHVPLSPPEAVPARSVDPNEDIFPRLFCFGQVTRQKGADLLLDSLPVIAKRFPKFKLTIAGSESVEYGKEISYAEVMRAELKKMGLAANVEFIGRVSREQIKQNVVDADICVFPSKYETAGYACLEAVSYGGVVVATAVGGLPEYHKHGETAWLVQPNSPQDLSGRNNTFSRRRCS